MKTAICLTLFVLAIGQEAQQIPKPLPTPKKGEVGQVKGKVIGGNDDGGRVDWRLQTADSTYELAFDIDGKYKKAIEKIKSLKGKDVVVSYTGTFGIGETLIFILVTDIKAAAKDKESRP